MDLVKFIQNLTQWGKPTSLDSIPVPIGHLYVRVQRPDGKIIRTVRSHNLRTNGGRDWQSAQMGGTTLASAQYIALSEDTTAVNAADTSVTGELSGSGFTRALGTYSHTAGARTYTISATWTAGATRTIVKVGLFNASSGPTLCFESTIPAVTVATGQILSIFWTVDLGA